MTIRTEVQTKLQDDATRLTDVEVDELVGGALRELADDVPQKAWAEVTGNDTRYYFLDGSNEVLPTGEWEPGVSDVAQVRTQSGDDWVPLDGKNWRVTEELDGGTWTPALFVAETWDASVTFRLQYTKGWTEGDAKLSGRTYEALLELATAKCHKAIAADYASMNDSTHGADAVSRQEVVRAHLDLHDVYLQSYRKLVDLLSAGDNSAKTGAASVTVDLVDYVPTPGGINIRRGTNN